MGTTFIPKRPHKKSRQGCKTCKSRKIKCDEIQPKCGFCTAKRLSCLYGVSSRTGSFPDASSALVVANPKGQLQDSSETFLGPPKISLIPGYGDFRLEDMSLIHHYSTWATDHLVHGEGPRYVMRYVLPPMAMQKDFLLNAMLGVAASHKRALCPENEHYQNQLMCYRDRALRSYQAQIPLIHTLPLAEYEAMTLMCLLLVLLFGQDLGSRENLTIIRWLHLYNGIQILFHSGLGWSSLVSADTMPLFNRDINELNVLPTVPTILLDMVSCIAPEGPDAVNLEVYCDTLDKLSLLYASLRQGGVDDALGVRISSWLSRPNREFVDLAARQKPRALIILAYFLCFVKLTDLWWMTGLAEQEIPIISEMLGTSWMPYMALPLRIAKCESQDEIVRMLLT